MQLAVIAKEPVPGRVKTRLCPPCRPEQAAELAEAALADTLETVLATPAHRHVLVLDGEPGPWLPDGFDVVEQRGDGLAQRLASAFDDSFRTSDSPVVLVGMDTPQITSDALRRASARVVVGGAEGLRRAVLGPALDGGYWLLGLSHPCAAVFEGVPMSVGTTGACQLRRLREGAYDVAIGETARDVDTIEDAFAVADLAPASRFARTLRRFAVERRTDQLDDGRRA